VGWIFAKLIHGDGKEWVTRHSQLKVLPHDNASSTGLSALFQFCWGLLTLGPYLRAPAQRGRVSAGSEGCPALAEPVVGVKAEACSRKDLELDARALCSRHRHETVLSQVRKGAFRPVLIVLCTRSPHRLLS